MRVLKIILSLTLFLNAFAGDYIVFKSKYSDSLVFRAVSDSLVHGGIGFLSSALFFSHKLNISTRSCIMNMIICTVMSSVIDVDHVFVAKSIYLKDLTGLKQRGIFHCTTFWILATALLISYSFFIENLNIYILSFMVMLAFTSHHIRDGNRRGLWVYPFGHTAPINKYIYAMLLGFLPNIFAYMFVYTKNYLFVNHAVEYMTV